MPITGSDPARMVARLGVMRLGASRLDYYQPIVFIRINGVDRKSNVRLADITITQVVDGEPDRLTCRVDGFTPVVGHTFVLALGELDTAHTLFAGHIIRMTQVYEEIEDNVAFDLECVDYTWLLNQKKVTKRYTSTSATAIATDLIDTFTSGFLTTKIQAGLATIDEITFTDEEVTTALDRLCARFGGYWVVDAGKRVRLGTVVDVITAHPVTDSVRAGIRNLALTDDLSQVATRVQVVGSGSEALISRAAGDTAIPVLDAVNFPDSGTVVSGPQAMTFTSKLAGGAVASVDGQTVAIAAPTAVPNNDEAAVSNQSIIVGGSSAELYILLLEYAVTFEIAGGETTAGTATGYVIPEPYPVTAPTLTGTTGGSLDSSATYKYYVRNFSTDASSVGPPSPIATIALTGGQNAVQLSNIPLSTHPSVTQRRLYRTDGNGSTYKFVTALLGAATTYLDTAADGDLTNPDDPDDLGEVIGFASVGLSAVAVGPTGTTARHIYRRATIATRSDFGVTVLVTPWGRIGSIDDNVTTTFTDDNMTASSTATPPPSVSTAPTLEGSTSLPVSDTSIFSASGGFVLVSGMALSYTGRSASSGAGSLTGIPASGEGSIGADIQAGSVVTVAPTLLGIPASGDGAIQYAIAAGDPVNFRVEVEDTDAQTAHAARIGGDGVVVEVLPDHRLSVAEATARGHAFLDLNKDPLTTANYATRDQSTRAGRTISITLGAPTSRTVSLRLQSVTITELGQSETLFPLRSVDASSRRFSFDDLLRQVRGSRVG